MLPIKRLLVPGWLALVILCTLILGLVTNRAGAEAPAWGKDFADMLDAGWRLGAEAQNAADDHYRAVQKLAGNDPRVEYAWALVLIKQRRHDAALEQLDRILKQDPGNLTALTWKARLRLHNKKFPEAIVALEELSAATSASLTKASEAPQRTEGLAAARFLGRAYGFLEGPAELKATQLEELKATLDQSLAGDARQAFDASRASVLEQFNKFHQQGQQHQAEDQQKEELDKKKKQEQVDAKKGDLERELSNITAERTRLRDEQRKELSDISREARQADAAQSQAESRLSAVLRQWNIWQNERSRFLLAMDAEADLPRREMWRNEVARIDISLGTIEGERRIREGDVFRARAQRADIERTRQIAVRRHDSELAALNKREDAARHGKRSLGGKQKEIDKPVSGNSSRQRNLNARATVFATYDETPLDIEKARLLASVK